MSEYNEIKRQVEAVQKTAQILMREDNQLRMIVHYAVNEAMRDFPPIEDEHDARKYAARVAEHAAALAVSRLVTEDAAIHLARAERDHYKKLAEQSWRLAPAMPFIVATI